MRFWKSWPYWVRGGIIGIVLDIIFLMFGSISSSQDAYEIIFHWNQIALITLIVAGTIFGWFYGKIKNRGLIR